MIKVVIETENIKTRKVIVSGHANYDVYGKDIVCASVSSIITTTINGILKIDEESINYNDNNTLLIEVLKDNKIINILIDNMVNLLEELEEKYNKNIRIIRR